MGAVGHVDEVRGKRGNGARGDGWGTEVGRKRVDLACCGPSVASRPGDMLWSLLQTDDLFVVEDASVVDEAHRLLGLTRHVSADLSSAQMGLRTSVVRDMRWDDAGWDDDGMEWNTTGRKGGRHGWAATG